MHLKVMAILTILRSIYLKSCVYFKIILFVLKILLNSLQTIIFMTSYRKHDLNLSLKLCAKVLCLSVLFYGGIEVTKEYFSYPYVYRLSVKPSERLDLPPITVCTERHVFFDKIKISQYFNISHEYESYKQIAEQNSTKLTEKCLGEFKNDQNLCKILSGYKNYLLNKFYIKYKNILLTKYTFNKLYNEFTKKPMN